MNTNALYCPLDEFYKYTDTDLPQVKIVLPNNLPEPHRSLLVHKKDLTPTLENFYKESIHIKVLDSMCTGTELLRKVILVLDGSLKPVAFGAIKIQLNFFDSATLDNIMKERLPLGTILELHQMAHLSSPQAFLQVVTDCLIQNALGLSATAKLYGRQNFLLTPNGEILAKIVEILSPKSTRKGALNYRE